MRKTHLMLLIEARAGQDIRAVMTRAYEETGDLRTAAEWIAARYDVQLSHAGFNLWVRQLQGEPGKTLRFPADEPQAVAR